MGGSVAKGVSGSGWVGISVGTGVSVAGASPGSSVSVGVRVITSTGVPATSELPLGA